MNDMSSVITPKSDQINADDLLGRTMTITVAAVQLKGGQEQPVSIYFEGSDKAFRPCKSMCRVLVQGWGLDANQYVGRSMTLYCDPTVKFGPLAVGGIRISHLSHIDGPMTMALTATKGVKKAYKVLPLVVEREPASVTSQDVRGWIMAAQTIEDLVAVWKRRDVAPFRDELLAVKDARKEALENPATGRSDQQHGDQHDDLSVAIAELANCKTSTDVDKLVNVLSVGMTDDDAQALRAAAVERIADLTQ